MNIFKSGYWCVTVQGEDDMGLHRGKPRLLLGQAMGMSPGKEAEKGTSQEDAEQGSDKPRVKPELKTCRNDH